MCVCVCVHWGREKCHPSNNLTPLLQKEEADKEARQMRKEMCVRVRVCMCVCVCTCVEGGCCLFVNLFNPHPHHKFTPAALCLPVSMYVCICLSFYLAGWHPLPQLQRQTLQQTCPYVPCYHHCLRTMLSPLSPDSNQTKINNSIHQRYVSRQTTEAQTASNPNCPNISQSITVTRKKKRTRTEVLIQSCTLVISHQKVYISSRTELRLVC